MALTDRLAGDGGIVTRTGWHLVDLHDGAACAAVIAWWKRLTGAGGEGMLVKPRDFIARDAKGLIQPALKIGGREYLWIIYEPGMTRPSISTGSGSATWAASAT